ncbi:hypothetical protein ACC754_37195, partial [Rhizobium johnstonii]
EAACRSDTIKLQSAFADVLADQRHDLHQVFLAAALEPPCRDNRIAITAKQPCNTGGCLPKLKHTAAKTPSAVNLEAYSVPKRGGTIIAGDRGHESKQWSVLGTE